MIERRTNHDPMLIPIGPESEKYYYDHLTPRSISWNCKNKKCDQYKGKPISRPRNLLGQINDTFLKGQDFLKKIKDIKNRNK